MNNPIKDVVAFNQKAGLLEKDYDDFLEDSFTIEESLEGWPIGRVSAKTMARQILQDLGPVEPLADVDRLDKACDKVVFAIGSMAKLKLNAHQITRALNIVMKYNNAKLSMPKDEHGKLLKPDNFVGPETELQKILDER